MNNIDLIASAFLFFAAAFGGHKLVRATKQPLEISDSVDRGTGQYKVNVPTPKPKPQRIAGIDTLARTIWGEARGQGYSGMQAVASVVMNRYEAAQRSSGKARQYGRTVEEICKKPYQFSVWNKGDPSLKKMLAVNENNADFRRAVSIADKALRGELPDNTGGADHYLNIEFTRKIRRNGTLPDWVDLSRKTASIGAHTFLKLG